MMATVTGGPPTTRTTDAVGSTDEAGARRGAAAATAGAGELVDDGSGGLRARLVTDPTLVSRFRGGRPSRNRRGRARRKQDRRTRSLAVVAALGAVARCGRGVVVVRQVSAEGSAPLAAVPATTPAGRTTAGPRAVTTPPAAASPAAPLATVIKPGDSSGGPMRTAAAVALTANPNVRLEPEARRTLVAGLVDARLTTVVAILAAETPLRVGGFSAVADDPPGTPLRQVVLATLTPSAGGALNRSLSAQTGDFAVEVVAEGSDGQLVRLLTRGQQ